MIACSRQRRAQWSHKDLVRTASNHGSRFASLFVIAASLVLSARHIVHAGGVAILAKQPRASNASHQQVGDPRLNVAASTALSVAWAFPVGARAAQAVSSLFPNRRQHPLEDRLAEED
jgi:hypothetical protein